MAWLSRRWETALADVDLSLAQYRTLAFLADGDSAASLLADRMDVSRPSITALVDGLVARGLVERRASEDDRRRVVHVITAEGRSALVAADERLGAEIDRLADHLDHDRARTAVDGMVAMLEALDRRRSVRAEAAGATR